MAEEQEKHPADRGGKHPLARMFALGVVLSAIGVGIGLWIDWFPRDASSNGHQIDRLWDVLIAVSVPIFVLVMTVAIYSVVRFRARPGDKSDGAPIHGNARLEVVWVAIPTIIVSLLAAYAWIVLDNVEAKKPNELVVDVYGQQFTWHFDYPQRGTKPVRSTELWLPKDRPVYFRVHTEDVIHSFWVPEFRLKTDAVPGMTTHIRVTPNRLGTYRVVCTELCGLGHSTMRQIVRVVEPAQFDGYIQKKRQGGQTQ
ncbi:MAG: cytochrome c oxidase subunit [Thermoleophilales bacterium]|nr:cytochrome c oxidase subunit [Thermoleophilales bacterium]